MSINLNIFGKMGINENRSFTIPWGKGNVTPPEDPFREAEVRDIIRQEAQTADSHIAYDNRSDNTWGADLDQEVGRVLKMSQKAAPTQDLKGGSVNPAISVRYDVASQKLSSMDVTSESGNFSSHTVWEQGEFRSTQQERVLTNGDVEILSLTVDPAKGTLTYTTELKRA